ncbi:MAG: hypothetical protein HOW73_02235 [Polyangiaceae bacterium]|nr:hypothetical protein [Polyangiaceae bacterium]
MFQLDNDTAEPRTTTASAARPGRAVDVHRLAVALKRGSRVIALSMLAAGVLGYAVAKTASPVEYESRATIVWEPDEGEQVDRQRAMKTLVDSVKIPSVLARVRQRLDMPLTLDQVSRRIDVVNTPQSNVLVIAAVSSDADEAQNIAQAALDSLLEERTELATKRAKEALARVEGDLPRAREAADRARSELATFRRESGLLDASSQTQAGIQQASRLKEEADIAFAEAEGQRVRSEILREAAKRQQERTILSERAVLPENVKLAETRAERSSLEAELSSEHPKVAALRAAEKSLGGVAHETNTGATAERTLGRNPLWDSVQDGLVKSTAEEGAQRTRETAFRRMAQSTTDEVLRLGELDGRAASLATQLSVSDKRLHDLETSHATLVDGVTAAGPGLRVLVPADRPSQPSRSLKKIIVVASPILAGFVALLGILVRALWGLRAHTASEIAFWSGLPVAASSSWPSAREHVAELCADLRATWPAGVSPVRMAPVSTLEAAHVAKLARRLDRNIALERKTRRRGLVVPAVHGLLDGHPAARRELRAADRNLLVVRAGAHSILDLLRLRTIASDGARVALVVIDVRPELDRGLADVGDATTFWKDDRAPRPLTNLGEQP